MQINRVCEFFLDQTNSSNLPAFPLMSYPGPPGSPRHRFFHGSLPDPTWMSRSSCILTRLFPEFTQMFLHTLLETRDFDLLSTLETLLDLRYRPRSVTILQGKMLVTPLIRSNYLIKYIMLPVQMRDHSERRPRINLFGKDCPVEICPPAGTQFTLKQDKLDCIG